MAITAWRNRAGRTLVRTALLACAFVASAMSVEAQDNTAPAPPELRIEDPFAATLWRMDTDASGRHFVSSSANNTLTVWSLDAPDRARILRVPLREEERQRARAIALSPDGERIAYGVPPLRDARGLPRPGTARIYILARNGGAIEHIIEGVPTRPQTLRFSPDGTALAAGLSDGCGLRVWAVDGWSLIGSDDVNYGGAAGACCTAAQAADCDRLPDTPGLQFLSETKTGAWIVTSGDTGLRLYRRTGDGITLHLHKQAADAGLERPDGVAVSPDGTRIAVGDRRLRGRGGTVDLKVGILSAATLEPAREPLRVRAEHLLSAAFLDLEQVPFADQMSLNRVVWTERDGEEQIYAGGTLWCQIVEPDLLVSAPVDEVLDICAVRWRLGGEDEIGFIPAGIDRIMDFADLRSRGAVVYATQRRIGALDPGGQPLVTDDGEDYVRHGLGVDFRDRLTGDEETGLDFAISPDGQQVWFEDYRSTPDVPLRFSFSVPDLALDRTADVPGDALDPELDPVLVAPRGTWWNRQAQPEIYGKTLAIDKDPNDVTRAVALTGKRRALIGSANFIRLADYSGGTARLLCERRVSAEAFRVNITPDGSLAVVGHGDGTIRWFRIIDTGADGACAFEHVLSVHIGETEWGSDSWSWTAWMPATGQFANDADASPLLTWQVMRPDGQVATLRHARMLDLYDRQAVSAALTRTPPAQHILAELRARVARTVDPVTLTVTAPGDLQTVASETVPFELKLEGAESWPRRLSVELGSGVRTEKGFEGKSFAPDTPIELTGPGKLSVDVRLPASVRRANANLHVCFVLDGNRTCHTLNWAGKLEAPAKRRLWATIVGFSGYADASLNLRFAQNDALDLARLFIDDYRARVVDRTSQTPPDYDRIRIDLIVSPTTDAARAELAELAKLPYVHVHEPTIANVRASLERVAARDEAEELSDDLMLFYYSGHGMLHPYNTQAGRTALLGPDIDPAYSRETLATAALDSAVLLGLLRQISAEKLVIFDACRTTAAIPSETPFDPGIVNKEFEEQVLSAHFLFSARAGQFSLEQKRYVFSSRRPEETRGNGLFTYALLRALTDPAADLAGRVKGRNRIEVWEIGKFLDRFFDPDDRESAARKLVDTLRDLGIATTAQQPKLVPARQVTSDISVVRSLDGAE